MASAAFSVRRFCSRITAINKASLSSSLHSGSLCMRRAALFLDLRWTDGHLFVHFHPPQHSRKICNNCSHLTVCPSLCDTFCSLFKHTRSGATLVKDTIDPTLRCIGYWVLSGLCCSLYWPKLKLLIGSTEFAAVYSIMWLLLMSHASPSIHNTRLVVKVGENFVIATNGGHSTVSL